MRTQWGEKERRKKKTEKKLRRSLDSKPRTLSPELSAPTTRPRRARTSNELTLEGNTCPILTYCFSCAEFNLAWFHFQLTNFCKGSPGAKMALVDAELHKTVIQYINLILATGNQVFTCLSLCGKFHVFLTWRLLPCGS